MFIRNFKFRVIFLFFSIFIVFLFYVYFIPVNKKETLIEIKNGDILNSVVSNLYDNKVIDSKFLFKFWIYLTFNQNNLKIGEYKIPYAASINNIKNIITSGYIYNKYITIPEGLTIKQIKEILSNNFDLKGEIVEKIEDGDLLPQTYAYNKSVTKNDIILRMKDAMNATIDKEWDDRDVGLPIKTKKDAIILASIVEKETGISEERGLVASVFINRLNLNMRLQSDPTVVYTLTNKYGSMKGKKLYSKHLSANTKYNTYRIKGLPIGAICNPGIDSIRAVLHPAKTDYLYFVADGSGGHKFAKTLAEHEKNRKEWKKFKLKNN